MAKRAPLLAILLLLAEVLLFHWRVLFTADGVIPWDIRYFHLPHAEFTAESFRRGEFPLWDPYTYFGRPFQANIQTQLFYPPRLATILLSNLTGGEHLLDWLEWELVLHIFLGGVFTLALMRRLGTGYAASLAAATVYQLGGFFASQAQHLGIVNAGAWLPLAWLCVLHMREGKVNLRRMAPLAATIALAVLCGSPALAFAVVASAFVLAALLACFAQMDWRSPAAVVVCAFWGFLLAALQLLPTIELNSHSIAQYRTEWLASRGSLPLESLASLIWPNYYGIFDLSRFSGQWEITQMYLYCGLAGLALAVAAAVARPAGRMFGLLALIFGVAMLGTSTPIGRVALGTLPDKVRAGVDPSYLMPAFVLGVAVLAGLGTEWFLKRDVLRYGAVLLMAADLTLAGSGRPMNTASLRAEPGNSRHAFEGSSETLARMRLLTNQTRPPARIDTVNDSMQWAMSAPMLRIPSASGNDPMAPARPMRVRIAFCGGERWGAYYQVARLDSPVLDMVNIRYLLSRTPLDAAEAEQARLVHIADLPGRLVYENLEAGPRYYLTYQTRSVAGLEEAVRQLEDPAFDWRRESIVEGPEPLAGSPGDQAGSVRLVSYSANRLELEVRTPLPAFLATSESHYPGWRAWVNGQPEALRYTNVAFRGLNVSAGTSRVVMQFSPSLLWLGIGVSFAAWMAWGLCLRRDSAARGAK